MIMHDCCPREKYGAKLSIHSAANIDVLRVHEELFVKEPDLAQRGSSEEHKTARKIGNIHHAVIAGKAKLEALHSPSQ